MEVWREYGVPAEYFSSDYRANTLAFLTAARARHDGGVIVATINGLVVGSVGYLIELPPIPQVLRRDLYRVGYIWTVFVEPLSRGRGIGTQLLENAIAALKAVGCTMIKLHASDIGASLYRKLGFEPDSEMTLELSR